MRSNRFLLTVVVRSMTLLAAAFAVMPVQAIHYWTGLGADSNWSTLENWSTTSATGATATALPTASDPVYFEKDATVFLDQDATCGMVYWNADNISVEISSDSESPKTLNCTTVNGGNATYFRSGCTVYVHDLVLSNSSAANFNWKGDSVSTFERVRMVGAGAITIYSAQTITFKDCYMSGTFSAPASTTGAPDIRWEGCTYENRATTGNLLWLGNSSNGSGIRVTMKGCTVTAGSTGNAVFFCASDVKIFDSTFTTGPCWSYGIACDSSFYASNTTFNVQALGNHSTATKTGVAWSSEFRDCTINLADGKYLYLRGGKGSDHFVNSSVNTAAGGTQAAGIYFGNIDETRETVFEDSQVYCRGTYCYLIFDAATYKERIVVRGKKTHLEFSRGSTASADFVFEIPVGGYERIPVFCTGCNADLFTRSGAKVSVSAASPAAMAEGTAFYPLMYMRNAAGTAGYLNFANAPLDNADMANESEGSCWQTLATKNLASEAEVAASADWTALAAGATYSATAAGLGATVVGVDRTAVTLSDFTLSALTAEGGATLSYALGFDIAAQYADVTVELWEKDGAVPVATSGAVRRTASGTYGQNFTSAVIQPGKDYLAKISVACANGRSLSAADVAFKLDVDKPNVTDVAVAENHGDTLTISGTVENLGAGGESATVTVSLAKTRDGETLVNPVEKSALNLVKGSSFTAEFDGLDPESVYYYCVRIVNSEGEEVVFPVQAVTTVGATTVVPGSFVVTRDYRLFAITGTVANFGAGQTKVVLSYSLDGGTTWAAVESEALDETATGVAVSLTVPETADNREIAYFVGVKNELAGQAWEASVTAQQAETVVDDGTYVWQAVDGEWNGDWSDPAHWVASGEVRATYPNSADVTVSFAGLPTDRAISIALPSVAVAAGSLAAPAGIDLRLSGSGSLTAPFKNLALSGSRITLDGCSFTAAETVAGQIVIGDGHVLAVINGASFRGDYYGQTAKTFTLALTNGTANIQYVYTTAAVRPAVIISGPESQLTMQCFGNSANAYSGVDVTFDVPAKGFNATPLVLTGFGNAAGPSFRCYHGDADLAGKIAVHVSHASRVYSVFRSKTLVVPLIAYTGTFNGGKFGITGNDAVACGGSDVFSLEALHKPSLNVLSVVDGNKVVGTFSMQYGLLFIIR